MQFFLLLSGLSPILRISEMESLSVRNLISATHNTFPIRRPVNPFRIRRFHLQIRHFRFVVSSKQSYFQGNCELYSMFEVGFWLVAEKNVESRTKTWTLMSFVFWCLTYANVGHNFDWVLALPFFFLFFFRVLSSQTES